MTCVPGVVAGSPGQCGPEGEDQVEQSPGQDYDVGHTAVEEDQKTTVADTCQIKHTGYTVLHYHFDLLKMLIKRSKELLPTSPVHYQWFISCSFAVLLF